MRNEKVREIMSSVEHKQSLVNYFLEDCPENLSELSLDILKLLFCRIFERFQSVFIRKQWKSIQATLQSIYDDWCDGLEGFFIKPMINKKTGDSDILKIVRNSIQHSQWLKYEQFYATHHYQGPKLFGGSPLTRISKDSHYDESKTVIFNYDRKSASYTYVFFWTESEASEALLWLVQDMKDSIIEIFSE